MLYEKSDVFFFFFTAKRRKIELIFLQAALADYLQEGWANWWSNDKAGKTWRRRKKLGTNEYGKL